jgi:hypothetical protein
MIAVLLILISSAASPQDSEVYFPTRAGATWTYSTPDQEIVRTVTQVELKDGAKVVSVGSVHSDGTTSPYRKIAVSDGGLVELESPVVVIDKSAGSTDQVVEVRKPPLDLLKLPAKPGDTWEYSTDDRTFSLKTAKPELVKTPAGEFHAVPVDLIVKLSSGGPTAHARYWYAKDVGVVKWTSRVGNVEQAVVLKSFDPGKD